MNGYQCSAQWNGFILLFIAYRLTNSVDKKTCRVELKTWKDKDMVGRVAWETFHARTSNLPRGLTLLHTYILDFYLRNLFLWRALILTTNHEVFRRCSHSSKRCRSILVQTIKWMLTKSGWSLSTRQQGQDLAPKWNVKVVPQQKSNDVLATLYSCRRHL